MPPKKKKTQMKKVERGFATTSIPKKVVAPPVAETEPEPIVDVESVKEPDVSKDAVNSLDERELKLQDFVDRCQERTEKEILRNLKTIEYERRISTTWPLIELDEGTQNEILQMLEGIEPVKDPWSRTASKDSDKFLEQLGILYGTLRRLGLRDSSVMESIAFSSKIDLDEVTDWLYIRSVPDDLEFDSVQQTQGNKISIREINQLAPAIQAITSPSPSPPKRSIEREKGKGQKAVSQVKPETPAITSQLALMDIDEDPNIAYVQLKLKVFELTSSAGISKQAHPNDPLIAALHSRIDAVKKDYLFREKLAEAQFQAKRKEWLSSSALARLQGRQTSALSTPPESRTSVSTPIPATDSPPKLGYVFNNDSDNESEGGMLQLLEPMPSEVIDSAGTTITVRNLPIPKTWTNRTPKRLLQEVATSLDRSAAISYKELSGGSRAKRMAVTVRWAGGLQSEWVMNDVACHDLPQAEFYIATLAAHALTYASHSEGFQVADVNSKSQTAYKSLPPSFRDLWEELERKRKSEEDKNNRDIWAKLGDLLEIKSSPVEETRPTQKKASEPSQSSSRSYPSLPFKASSEIESEYQKMQATTAYQDMLLQRNTLPIAAYRGNIVDTIDTARVVVLSGETGCGKSTQLPSFILEDHLSRGQHCKIVVTEPRRISAISLAQRVSQELGEASGTVGTSSSLVGYSIRLESHTSKKTRLTFVTNGIALRMLESGSGKNGQGTAFDDITHIVVDEVHERNIDSDFLLIVLKSLLDHRRDLKVILMSATLDAEKISNFFGGCPIISVPGRTFPVEVRYLEDAIEYVKYSITPTSSYAIRGFGQSKRTKDIPDWNEDLMQDEDEIEQDTERDVGTNAMNQYSIETKRTFDLLDEYVIPYELIIRLLETVCFEDPGCFELSHAFLIFMPGLAEIRRLNEILNEHPRFGSNDFLIYPLHSTIPSDGQGIVFEVPPQGIRKIVIATNIAETGVTIPDITCVIDTGKHKEMRYDEKRQISRLIQSFVAKSNATQRRGRAGRVRSGLCFHLFSSVRHSKMAEHPLPEMLRLSLSDLALRIKIMKVNLGTSIQDVLSRALDPPSTINIQRAVAALVEVKALTETEEITPMGRLLSKLPTDVHLGKFLLVAALFKCLDPALTVAATLNSKSPFITPFGLEQEAERAKAKFASGSSDFLTIHNAFASFRRASANPGFIRKFCRDNYLSQQNLQQIEELRQQFLGYLIDSSFIKVDTTFSEEFRRARYSRQRNTRFVTVPPEYDANTDMEDNNMCLFNAALASGLYPKLLNVYSSESSNGQSMKMLSNNQAAFFHPSSVNFGRRPGDLGAGYLMYFTIVQSKRLYAWETAPVDDLALVLLCGDAEFKLISNTIDIDRKIKYRVAPKTNVALKHLRKHLLENLSLRFKGKELSETQKVWETLAIKVLGRVKSIET